MSSSVAARTATAVAPRPPSSSLYTSFAARNALLTFSRTSSSRSARSTYGRATATRSFAFIPQHVLSVAWGWLPMVSKSVGGGWALSCRSVFPAALRCKRYRPTCTDTGLLLVTGERPTPRGDRARDGTADEDGAPLSPADPDRLDPRFPRLRGSVAPAQQPAHQPLHPSRHRYRARREHPPEALRAANGRVVHPRRPDRAGRRTAVASRGAARGRPRGLGAPHGKVGVRRRALALARQRDDRVEPRAGRREGLHR